MAETKKVTRITAKDDAPKKSSKATSAQTTKVSKAKPAAKTVKTAKVTTDAESTTKSKNIFVRIGRYFKGAWVELRQVRWPNRKATWALTLAVIVFSLFFMLLITLLDVFFKWIFELIIA